MTIKSADALIVATESEKLGKTAPAPVATPPDTTEANADVKTPEVDQGTEAEKEKPQEQPQAKPSDDKASTDEQVDEYGNKISTEKRLYTQEEVNQIMRDRAARGRQQEQATTAPEKTQGETKTDTNTDSNGEKSWQDELNEHIDQRILTRTEKEQQRAWEAEQQREQEAYQERFTASTRKYADFESTVQGKPITASMMIATKSMDDPAAFLYAACKQHPQELERIAKITDPYAQIAEVARLEERMKRPKKVTAAPAPTTKITGDQTDAMPKQSIDSLIAAHAKDKIMNNRRWK